MLRIEGVTDEVKGLKQKLSLAEEENIVTQRDIEAIGEKCKRVLEGCDVVIRRAYCRARRSLAVEYDDVLDAVRAKLLKKKEEAAAEVALQRVRARIEVLSEYKEGGFELDEELKRLREREIECDVDYNATAVSDPSLGRIDLPQISGDSVNQALDNADDQADS